MAIKVLRLIEYTYRDENVMAEDQLRWTMSHNSSNMKMRSAVLQPEQIDWVDDTRGPEISRG